MISNRLTLMGFLIVALSAAGPSVAAAQNHSQNPWRSDPQATGQYAPPQPATPAPTLSVPKYAPLDGKLISEAERTRGAPVMGTFGGASGGGYPGGLYSPYGPGYGALRYGYPGVAPGYGGYGYPGLGYSGLGYPGLATPGLGLGGFAPGAGWGSPYGGSGLWPGLGMGNGLGGPTSWMPFW